MSERLLGELAELLLVFSEARPEASKGIGGSEKFEKVPPPQFPIFIQIKSKIKMSLPCQHWVPQLRRLLSGLRHAGHDVGRGHLGNSN